MATKVRLTKAVIDGLQSDPAGKPVIMWDEELGGFGVLVAKGGRKVYVVQRGNKISRRTIERCDLMTLKAARQTATEWLAMIGKGVDPKPKAVVAPAPATTNPTVRDIAELYLQRKQRRPATVRLYRLTFGSTLYLGVWADKPIAEINSDDVRAEHNRIMVRIAKRPNRPGYDGKSMGDQAMRLFRALWNFAARLDGKHAIANMPTRNPVATLGAGRDSEWHLPDGIRKRTRFVDDSDLPKFWKALDADPLVNPAAVTCVKLMLLSGLRIGTATNLRWDMIDLDNKRIDIPSELMKGRQPFSIPLVKGTHELLANWRKRGVATSGYVFPSAIGSKHICDCDAAFALVKKQTGKPYAAHDLRRTFATNCKRSKLSKWVTADLLAHAASSVTDGYDMTDVEDLREPLQTVTTRILALCEGTVTPLVGKPRKAA